jgi:hypothetical protein
MTLRRGTSGSTRSNTASGCTQPVGQPLTTCWIEWGKESDASRWRKNTSFGYCSSPQGSQFTPGRSHSGLVRSSLITTVNQPPSMRAVRSDTQRTAGTGSAKSLLHSDQ